MITAFFSLWFAYTQSALLQKMNEQRNLLSEFKLRVRKIQSDEQQDEQQETMKEA